jgi:hypothetical protein
MSEGRPQPIPRGQRVAAVITIRRAAYMTPQGRKAIAKWLRQHAADLLRHGGDYSARFVGRYLYRSGK